MASIDLRLIKAEQHNYKTYLELLQVCRHPHALDSLAFYFVAEGCARLLTPFDRLCRPLRIHTHCAFHQQNTEWDRKAHIWAGGGAHILLLSLWWVDGLKYRWQAGASSNASTCTCTLPVCVFCVCLRASTCVIAVQMFAFKMCMLWYAFSFADSYQNQVWVNIHIS